MNNPTQSWYALAKKTDISQTEISIYDEIGAFGVSAKSFLADLQRIPADHTILLKIHSPGGEVFDGNAIFNSLKRRAADVIVQIEGIAASMATVISLAGHHVKMAANGFYMIHNPWGMALGDAAELRDQAELLDKIRSNMVGAYAAKSGQSPEQIEEWMDAETWFTAEQAHAAGFVDEITDRLDIAASANTPRVLAKFRNTPAALLTPPPTQMQNAETQEPTAPEVIEEPAATVISESAPAEVQPEAISEEAAPAESTEQPAEQPAEVQPPAPVEPQAKAHAADAILAKYNAALAERDAALAEATAYKAHLSTERAAHAETVKALENERESLARLERSLGLAAAQVVPVVEPVTSEDQRAQIIEKLNATTDPRERNILARQLRQI
jgi:ATP-dependent Clp endopeptidase proteolytic subunit ClpP